MAFRVLRRSLRSARGQALLALVAVLSTPARAQSPTPVPAPPSALPSPQAGTATPSPSPDRVNDLIGTWSCATKAGSTASHTYARTARGVIALENVVRTADGERLAIHEEYAFDTGHQHWIVRSSFARFVGYGDPWSGTTWVVTGRLGAVSSMPQQRMTYALVGAGRFSRTFELLKNGRWEMTSVEACQRTALS